MIHVKKSVKYYINERALTFSENDLDDPQRVAVSLVSGTVIMVRVPGVIDYASDGNFERWTLKGYSTKLVNNALHYVYARLSRTDRTALVVFSVKDYNIDGSITTTGEGEGVVATVESSTDYFYIKIGELTATDGKSDRELTYDSGLLGTEQGNEESSPLNEMWELSKLFTPWLIRAKQWLADFTVKGFITLLGGLVFRKGDTEKPVTDIKRSVDSDEDVPVSDENLATSKYVESQLEDLDDRFLSKVKPDETPHHIKLLGGLTTTEAASDDYAKDILKAGWAARKDDDGNWYVEADKIVARILANVYDLLVENNAVFKGNLSSEEFISGFIGGKGWAIRMKEWENAAGEIEKKSLAEFDDLIVRGSMRVYEFIVSQMLGENDNRIFTGMMEVDHYDNSDGKIYLKTDGGKLYNPFREDDVIIVQQYGGMPTQESGYYVTKQYEFIVTEVGIGSLSDGEERLDWVKFRNFTTSMEGGDLSLIAERDTLVRIDNLSDVRRKGVIQMMSVGDDTPYMDIIYGAKTDPENSLKGRFGNIGGVYNPLFGWLKEFGAYLTNLYAVGEFRIAHTGEDVADAIEISKGQFRTNYRQTTYDMTEDDNFLTNAAMTNNCEHWVLGEEATSYFLVDGIPQFFNYELYGSEDSFAGIAEHNGRDMLRLSSNTVLQSNGLIRKPGTHKVHTGTTENADGTYTKVFEEVPDTLYLSVRVYCVSSGLIEIGFTDAGGAYYGNDFHVSRELAAQEDAYTIKVSSTWDGIGDFCIKSSGDMYIDLLSLTDKPLENFMITTSTSIEQDAERISLLGKKVNGVEGSVTNLGIELNAAEERITAYVDKEVDGVEASVSQLQVDVNGISTRVATAQGAADNAKKAADAAQKAADDAASDALAAQNTADSASSKATANATAIQQTSQSISAISAAFQKDANGNLVLTSAAGAVITSDMAKIYATKDGVSAELATKVTYNPATGAVTSKIVLTADQINLTGAVTYSMLNSSLKTTLDGKLDQGDLDGYATDSELASAQKTLNDSISALNTTLTAKIDEKATTASLESLSTKVTELNTALGGKADTSKLGSLAYIDDVANAALSGSTLIVNGYLNTDYCRVKTIEATKGTVGSFEISGKTLKTSGTIDEVIEGNPTKQTMLLTEYGISTETRGNIYCSTNFGLKYGYIIDTNYYFPIEIAHGVGSLYGESMCGMKMEMKSSDIGIYINGGSTHILSSGITKIHGLAVNHSSSTGTAATNVDFITISSGTVTLPSPYLCPGKVYFVKKAGGSLTVPNFIGAKSTVTSSTEAKESFEDRPYIFISSGSAWFEFYCSWD